MSAVSGTVMPETAPATSSAGRAGSRRAVKWFLLGAAYAGFVISLYLTFVHYRGYISPCYVVHGCEQVQTSRYSSFIGIPLALLGTLYFAAMFYLGIGLLARPHVRLVQAFKLLAFAGALAAIPLFLLQAIMLRAFCSYCVTTEIILLAIWAASFMVTGAAAVDAGGADQD